MAGRHAVPDKVGIALSGLYALAGAGLLTLLALTARDPCPSNTTASGLAPISGSDIPHHDLPVES